MFFPMGKLANRIKYIRKQAGLSQEKFARRHCLRQSQREQLRQGRRFLPLFFRAIAVKRTKGFFNLGQIDERSQLAKSVGRPSQVLNRAFRHLLAGAELIALQKNRYWLREDGLCLDVGPFVAALEYAAGCKAHVVGKPAAAFFSHVLDGVGTTPDRAVMVGDDVESDIGGALGAGLAAIMVRTGKYRSDAVLASGIQPTATVDSIADVPDLLTTQAPTR